LGLRRLVETQCRQQTFKVFGQLAFKPHVGTCAWMRELERAGVQSLTRKPLQFLPKRLAWPPRQAWTPAIDRIPDQRSPDVRHVHSNLMRPAGLEFYLDVGVCPEALNQTATNRYCFDWIPLDEIDDLVIWPGPVHVDIVLNALQPNT